MYFGDSQNKLNVKANPNNKYNAAAIRGYEKALTIAAMQNILSEKVDISTIKGSSASRTAAVMRNMAVPMIK